MRITAIYDNGGKTLDRYSVVTDYKPENEQGLVDMLGLSEGGIAYSQWGYGQVGRHLGKKIHFEDLSAETQQHIVDRLFGKDE